MTIFERTSSTGAGRPTQQLSSKVPRVIAAFWVTKALTTAFGESASDYLVRTLGPVPAVLLGFVAFLVTLAAQLRAPRYRAVRYWSAVAMVGVFGTMAADVLHVGLHVPYAASTVLFAVGLGGVFATWWRCEGTLSVHAITPGRREWFYWTAVVGTFALGTAAGDLAATTGGLGYGAAALVFALAILAPALGHRFLHWNGVAAFWAAYVLTRPVGASVADWLGKPLDDGGLGIGSGVVTLVLGLAIVVLVGLLAVTRADDPERS